MENYKWTAREGNKVCLARGSQQIASFVDGRSAQVGDAEWTLELDKNRAQAHLPDGSVLRATPDKGTLAKAKMINAELKNTSVSLVNEAKQDWIIDSAEGTKLGQFTGADHGVRHPVIEFEPGSDKDLDHDEAVFLSWVARLALEQHMVSTTTIVTWSLVALTPIILLILFLH